MSLREKKKQAARKAIIDAASDLIGQLGYDRATMRDIATTANISYQTLYNYFPTKALIVRAMLADELTDATELIEQTIQTYPTDPLGLLRELTKIRFDVIEKHDRLLWREVIIEFFKQSEGMLAAFEILEHTTHERLVHTLEDFQASGCLVNTVDSNVLASVIFSLIDSSFMLYISKPDMTREELLRNLFAQLDLLVRPHLQNTH